MAITLYVLFYHPPQYKQLYVDGKTRLKQLVTFDWPGFILFTAGIAIFLIGLNWGGSVYPWSDGHVLGAFFAGLATIALFLVWDAFCKYEYPLRQTGLWRDVKYDAVVVIGCTACMPCYSFTVMADDSRSPLDNECREGGLAILCCWRWLCAGTTHWWWVSNSHKPSCSQG